MLAVDRQSLTTRRDDHQTFGEPDQALGQCGRLVDDVLTVVEDEQAATMAQHFRDARHIVLPGALLDAKRGDRAGDPYYDTKLATGRYFLARVLPEAGAHLAKLKSGAAPVMALQAEAF